MELEQTTSEVEDVFQLLLENDFDALVVEIFRANKIDRKVLIDLDRDDMKELGILALGDRKRLQQIIARMRETFPPRYTTLTSTPSLENCNEVDFTTEAEMLMQCSK